MSEPDFRRGYAVQLSDAAVLEISDYYDRIAADSPEAAQKWVNGLHKAVQVLGDFNVNFSRAPEDARSKRDLRQVIYYSHRVIYTIFDERREVLVLHVWHGARQEVPDRML